MGSMISIETLFWAPLGMDLLLLGSIYPSFRFFGLEYFFKTMNQHSSGPKKNDDDVAKSVSDESDPIHSVWDLALMAYSAYGCLLPWATYVCYNDPSHRTSLSWAPKAAAKPWRARVLPATASP